MNDNHATARYIIWNLAFHSMYNTNLAIIFSKLYQIKTEVNNSSNYHSKRKPEQFNKTIDGKVSIMVLTRFT